MSAIPPSTPFPVPGLNGTSDNANPAEFLSFLRNIINEYLGDSCPRITKNKDTWVTIVNGLTDHLLGTFPLPDVVSWDAMEEKVEMTGVSLEVIRRVFLRVESVDIGSEGIVRKLSARLLDFCKALDIWREAEVACAEGMSSPAQLRCMAFETLVSVLRCLGDNTPMISEEHDPSWKSLRIILKEYVAVVQGLMSPATPLPNSFVVSFYSKPHVSSSKGPDQEEASPLEVFIPSLSRIPSFLILIIDVLPNYLNLTCFIA
ncbi:hypothetical protein HYPSUDRAFT_31624 [Hypholoma sublateritium FD-334 SS-4]|uniref:Uncharacterized protein n=1 Tax=Hypholoma sublateritium (strain FD-334 SS-4) TaxID=945553 RepID=A0A0D2QDJ4_HYPSF|nr:hypothetical protein HYPSUDRAFT_31624 [Hypholoma sublateritium FD-334 SS-4]